MEHLKKLEEKCEKVGKIAEQNRILGELHKLIKEEKLPPDTWSIIKHIFN